MGRLAMLAAALAVVIGLGLNGPGDKARAMGLCNCCASALTPSCSKICSVISLAPGMCPAIVDYEGTGAAAESANPLNGMSLKDMALGEPTPWQLELFRKFLESARRQGIASYNSAKRQLKRKKITQAGFDKVDALYKEVLVNYYHGIRGYLNRVGTKSD